MPNIYEFGIVGMGPAGLGAVIGLQQTTSLESVICFERGNRNSKPNCPALRKENCCYSQKCDIITGIGGASTVSSGKMSCYPAGSGLKDFFNSEQELISTFNDAVTYFSNNVGLKKVAVTDETISEAEAFYKRKGIEYKYYDVYEFDGEKYREFVHRTMQGLLNKGLHLIDNANVLDIKRDLTTKLFTVKVQRDAIEEVYVVKNLVLATGALDIQDKLFSETIRSKDLSVEVGVRIEVPSEFVKDLISTHGDLKLKLNQGRTYCVTVDGTIITYQTGGVHFLEGCMDASGSSEFTNMAVLIKYDAAVLDSMLMNYRTLHNGVPVVQSYLDYISGKVSDPALFVTLNSYTIGDINSLFPIELNKAIKGFIESVIIDAMGIPEDRIVLAAPELKILRQLKLNREFELLDGLYVIGAATGKFRGILQGFISGVRCGEILARR